MAISASSNTDTGRRVGVKRRTAVCLIVTLFLSIAVTQLRGGAAFTSQPQATSAPRRGPGSSTASPATGPMATEIPDVNDSYYRGMRLPEIIGGKDGDEALKGLDLVCELNVLYTGNCLPQESWRRCVARVGAANLDKVLSSRCRRLPVWRRLMNLSSEAPSDAWTKLRRGFVYDSEVYTDDADPSQPPSRRKVEAAIFTPPRVCRNGCKHYPISFSVPRATVADRVERRKIWDYLPYLPEPFPRANWKVHFTIQDEWLKDQLHRHSYFAFTHKRGGWDCMRHLEILASGAVPYFADIELLPRNSLANYPKDLIKEAMALRGVEHVGQTRRHGENIDSPFLTKRGGHVNFKKPGTIEREQFNQEAYFELADRMLNWTKRHLTSDAVVSYMLKTIGYEEPKHVIMIGRWTYDYLHQSVENGLSDLGIKTTVVGHTTDWVFKRRVNAGDPPTEEDMELYREAASKRSGFRQISGLAWMYGFRNLPHVTRHANKDRDDASIKKRIIDGEFDLVIYSYTENEPVSRRWYWNEIQRVIPKERRIFLHHNDDVGDPDQGSMESCQHGTVFKREMHDTGC